LSTAFVNKFKTRHKRRISILQTSKIMSQASAVIRNYFRLVEKIYCHQIFTFDESTNQFSMQSKGFSFYIMFVKEIASFIVCTILPVVLLIVDTRFMDICQTHQTVFLILFLVACNHSFSLFVINYLNGWDFLSGLNALLQIQQIIKRNSKFYMNIFKPFKKCRKDKGMDIASFIVIFKFVSIGFVLISFLTPVFLLTAQVDAMYVLLNWAKVNSGKVEAVRIIVIMGTVIEIAHILGAAHLLIMLYSYERSVCFKQLPYVTFWKQKATHYNTNKLGCTIF